MTKFDLGTDRAPSMGLILARGAGYGSLLGGLFGFFIAPASTLVTSDDPFEPLMFVLGMYTAPVGFLYGLVVGLAAAALVIMVPVARRTRDVARLVAALGGSVAVVAISALVFHPSLTVTQNEPIENIVETAVIFYAYPALSALLCGALFGQRLVAPDTLADE